MSSFAHTVKHLYQQGFMDIYIMRLIHYLAIYVQIAPDLLTGNSFRLLLYFATPSGEALLLEI